MSCQTKIPLQEVTSKERTFLLGFTHNTWHISTFSVPHYLPDRRLNSLLIHSACQNLVISCGLWSGLCQGLWLADQLSEVTEWRVVRGDWPGPIGHSERLTRVSWARGRVNNWPYTGVCFPVNGWSLMCATHYCAPCCSGTEIRCVGVCVALCGFYWCSLNGLFSHNEGEYNSKSNNDWPDYIKGPLEFGLNWDT